MYIFSIEPASFDSRRMAAKKDSFKIIKLADPLNFIKLADPLNFDIHQEIKLQMRWSFGVLIALGGLVVGILRMAG